ncbi:MAG TPA: hypothetical protein VHB02_20285 [Acidimicrobiales bacterium]|nr:hypothetical protein [Acidimicrobiales bacterium]
MLTGRRGGALAGVALSLAALAGSFAATGAGAAGATATPPSGSVSSGGPATGVTVSWWPTTKPVTAVPGETTQGSFWVTNEGKKAVPVTILPATAIPGNNGQLTVKTVPDLRFPKITYSPRAFVVTPGSTTVVTVTVVTPTNLQPGIYLVPAAVRPKPRQVGNIKIQQQVNALVTFRVPGTTEANVEPSFVGPTSGVHTFHVPGLPQVQLGTSGNETLRVLDDSPSSFYAYNEISATQSPFGKVVFLHHAATTTGDLRNPPDLFFPHRWRDYPVVWSPSIAGFGSAHLTAYVGYQATSRKVLQKSTSTTVLVISPLWTLALAVYALLVLLGARRRARRQVAAGTTDPRRRTVAGRIWQVVASLVMVAVVVEAAFLSQPAVLAAVGGVGVVVAIVAAVTLNGADRPSAARRLRWYQWAAAVLAVVGAALAAVATVSSSVGPDLAVGVLAGTCAWVVLAWWLLWWNEERKAPVGPPPGADPPSPAEEPVPAAT